MQADKKVCREQIVQIIEVINIAHGYSFPWIFPGVLPCIFEPASSSVQGQSVFFPLF